MTGSDFLKMPLWGYYVLNNINQVRSIVYKSSEI